MKVLFISTSCSEKKYKKIYELRKVKAIEPQQKFDNLLIRGLSKNKDVQIVALSSLPVSYSTCDVTRFEHERENVSDSLEYEYISFRNGRFTRFLDCFLNTRKAVKEWINRNKGEQCFIIVDALSVFMAMGCFKLAKKNSIPVVGIVTDLPELATNMKTRKDSFLKKYVLQLVERLNTNTLSKYDALIPLTESINEAINTERPYLVIEGSVDSEITYAARKKKNPRNVVYAGGVYEKYGLKNLVEAFSELNTQSELHIYGDGTYVDSIKAISQKHPNIIYKGMVSLEEIVKIEQESSLLINPRPSNEEFSKYSFPSKTLEYMSSGTPLISTRLPGIPKDYFDYIYAIEDESKDGLKSALSSILSESDENLEKKGKEAYDFVTGRKSNVSQGEKIIAFLKTL